VSVGIPGCGGRRPRRLGCGVRWRHGRFGDTEICQARAPSCIEQDITWLQVAMDDSTLMCMLERLGNLQEHRNDFEETRAA
jgi:hypothetical protein